jgi:5-methylcytosine-specific restriction endonuclease McrA
VECGSDHKIHFDHVIPYSWGGADTVENLQILCQRCNQRRGNRHL